MNCLAFVEKINAYIDDELSMAERSEFLQHAQTCSACKGELLNAEAIADALSHMNDGFAVPLASQAAWRNAIRKETKRRKGRVLYRAISAVAASFVLLVGTTVAFRSSGVLDFGTSFVPVDGVHIAANTDRPEFYAQKAQYPSTDAPIRPMIESDGSDDEATPIAPNTSMDNRVTRSAAPESAAASNLPDSSSSDASQANFFVKSASREMYSETFDTTHQSIADLAEEYNGNMLSDAVTDEGGSKRASIAIDVPVVDLDSFLAALDFVGHVTYSEEKSEDISVNYYDAQGRIETLSLEKDRLNALIPASVDAEEIKALEVQLEDVYAQMDTLESKLRSFDNQLDYARVDIVLNEGAPLTATVITGASTNRTKQGFSRSLDTLGRFFSDMGVSLAVIAPYAGVGILLIGVIWVAALFIMRKRRHD